MRRSEVAARNTDETAKAGSLSPHAEARLLVQAVRSSKLPALTAEDASLFKELVGDVWPDVDSADAVAGDLREALQAAAAAQHLVDEPEQVRLPVMRSCACLEQCTVECSGPKSEAQLWRVGPVKFWFICRTRRLHSMFVSAALS